MGWGPVLSELLKLDFDTAVPGNGPAISRAELEAFTQKINILIARAAEMVNQGVPKDQLMNRLKPDDLGWTLTFTPEQIDGFYSELLARRNDTHAAQLNEYKLER